jgi:ParB-like nuclease family protein
MSDLQVGQSASHARLVHDRKSDTRSNGSGSGPSGTVTPLKVEMLPVEALQPYARNARTHSRKQVRQIANSIERFGFCNPVLIDDRGEIIAGHGRVAAAKLLGISVVPTVRLSHLTQAEKRAYILVGCIASSSSRPGLRVFTRHSDVSGDSIAASRISSWPIGERLRARAHNPNHSKKGPAKAVALKVRAP